MLGETLCNNIKASKWHESSTVTGGLYSKGTEPRPAPHRANNTENSYVEYRIAIWYSYKFILLKAKECWT